MASFETQASSQRSASPVSGGYDSDMDTQGSATYYDVLKCTGAFATPSPFFAQPLKPAHSKAQTHPWTPVVPTDSKQRLRRQGVSGDTSESSASSVFRAEHQDNALPPSVFCLPGAPGHALGSMTVGGRSLRRSTQVPLSIFDRKVNLV
ncbi:hypothetical protein IW150_005611 [Coemansia sp. RSA 2607]|nr:hypothetical protein IW150_005611 [Coemansia sp. RSA 2607]KAJ2381098.1 hypothetical protein GGI05_006092 [Coemansia sp. RSA 2603]